jgi:hypothetical protein
MLFFRTLSGNVAQNTLKTRKMNQHQKNPL